MAEFPFRAGDLIRQVYGECWWGEWDIISGPLPAATHSGDLAALLRAEPVPVCDGERPRWRVSVLVGGAVHTAEAGESWARGWKLAHRPGSR